MERWPGGRRSRRAEAKSSIKNKIKVWIEFRRTCAKPSQLMERWPSGRRRTPGKRVGSKRVSRVRIPFSPPFFVESPPLAESSWFVYLLKCSDDSYYTGIAQDVEERLQRHATGRGAEYTKARLPVELVYVEEVNNHSEALAREKWLKRQTHRVKEELVKVYKASPKRG